MWVDSGLTQRSCLLLIVPAGAQWEKAGEVFEAMQAQGCRPDVVTYTALIQAYERGGQWRRALAVSAAFGLSGAWCKQTRLWKAGVQVTSTSGAGRCWRAWVFRRRPAAASAMASAASEMAAPQRGTACPVWLQAFEDMRSRQCTPDSIILNIILVRGTYTQDATLLF